MLPLIKAIVQLAWEFSVRHGLQVSAVNHGLVRAPIGLRDVLHIMTTAGTGESSVFLNDKVHTLGASGPETTAQADLAIIGRVFCAISSCRRIIPRICEHLDVADGAMAL